MSRSICSPRRLNPALRGFESRGLTARFSGPHERSGPAHDGTPKHENTFPRVAVAIASLVVAHVRRRLRPGLLSVGIYQGLTDILPTVGARPQLPAGQWS